MATRVTKESKYSSTHTLRRAINVDAGEQVPPGEPRAGELSEGRARFKHLGVGVEGGTKSKHRGLHGVRRKRIAPSGRRKKKKSREGDRFPSQPQDDEGIDGTHLPRGKTVRGKGNFLKTYSAGDPSKILGSERLGMVSLTTLL